MEHIQSLLTQFQIATPKICTSAVPVNSPWTRSSTQVCPFIEMKKCTRTDVEMRTEFLAHSEAHPTVHIYTDGSKSSQHVGIAAVFPNSSSSRRLPGEASIFTAEMYAVKLALTKILECGEENGKFTVFFRFPVCPPGSEIRNRDLYHSRGYKSYDST